MSDKILSEDNGVDKIVEVDASSLAKSYYTEYAKYVLEYRALPNIYDGLKPVQRRIIYMMNQQPSKLMKTAKAAGLVMGLHPHGSSSIESAMNNMASPLNPMRLFNTKGNFGSINAGAASSRYTELYLNEIARYNYCQFMDYVDYEVGEIGEQEPSALACLIPYCLIIGSDAMGVGLSTKVMPLNLMDLIDYYIDYIKNDYKFNPNFLIRPDLSYTLIEMDKSDIINEVQVCNGRITVSSVVNQISNNTVILEGLQGRSIDAVINKINKRTHWFTDDKVGFRDASTTFMKYIFEIYDSSISIKDLSDRLKDATWSNSRFSRNVEEDGCAVYSTLNNVVSKSLNYLNKAIDKKIDSELNRSKTLLTIYEVLKICKDNGVFNDISKLTTDELVNKIINASSCTEEIAREIVKKPISYLTRSHENEMINIKNDITELESHDRKKYLLNLYTTFKKMIKPMYESRKHSITRDQLMNNPCISIDKSSGEILVADGKGEKFDNTVYFISDSGTVYKRAISSTTATTVILDASEKVNYLVTDKHRYIEILTDSEDGNYQGRLIVDTNNFKYDKRVVNLWEKEHICSVNGIDDITGKEWYVKSKVSRTNKR